MVINIWAACDATSSYAWHLHVYSDEGGATEEFKKVEDWEWSWRWLGGSVDTTSHAIVLPPREEADHGGNNMNKPVRENGPEHHLSLDYGIFLIFYYIFFNR